MNKKDYPVQVVEIREGDHRPPLDGGGGDTKYFGDVTDDLRQNLAGQIDDALKQFDSQLNRWPDVPAVLKITLKEEALAKSHRPVALFTQGTCPIIGTLGFGEVLVSGKRENIAKLKDVTLKTTGKKRKANLTAIDKIEPYRFDLSMSNESLDELKSALRSGIPLKLHTFDHNLAVSNNAIEDALMQLVSEYGASIKRFNYGTRCKGFLVEQDNDIDRVVGGISSFIGLQSAQPMPQYVPSDFQCQSSNIGMVTEELLPPPDPEAEYPVVGVIDSGVCPKSTLLGSWIAGRENYVPEDLQDNTHGTMVAGLIAGGRTLNYSDDRFPIARARILDVPVFEKDKPLNENDLVQILTEVVPKYPEVKVWNLSLGGTAPSFTDRFSDLACFLDELHDKHSCLFVVAAGNHHAFQKWPKSPIAEGVDRVSSPGDSTRALTVGAIAHKDSALSKSGEPSPFSRCGPGPCFIPKPEVTQFGGNSTSPSVFAQTGILSIGPSNTLCETIGTSFATPLVSAQAANLWSYLDNAESPCTPERIKALMIHSALLRSEKVTTETLHYYGFGQPGDMIDSLYCDPNAITMMFETDLRFGGYEFERWPFPVADSLKPEEGKFQGEILATLVYSPVTDSRYASEYCRTNVDVGMGSYEVTEEGESKREFKSVVPAAPKDYKMLYEKQQIEHGFKWSPVKAYYARFPRGKSIDTWRLKMKVSRRAEQDLPDEPQRACLLVTFRSFGKEQPVYNESIRAMVQQGWVMNNIDQYVNIEVGVKEK